MNNRYIFRIISVLVLIVIISPVYKSYSQLLSYTIATNGALASTATNTTGTGLIRVNGATAPTSPCSTGFSSTNFTSTTSYSTSLAAVETSITPVTGYTLNVTGFNADLRRSSSGPANVRFAYSIDGGGTWLAQSTDQANPSVSCGAGSTLTWAVSFSVIAPNTLKFRVYGFNASSVTGTQQVQNLMINGTVSTTTTGCSTPVGLSASAITSSSAMLNWSFVPGAVSYKLQYRVFGTTAWTTSTATTNSKTISGLTASTVYQFKVKSVCSGSSSVFSKIAKFTTTAPFILPVPDHIVILILENHGYNKIIGSSAAPHINALATDTSSALFTQSFGLTHPSQPNYIDLFSGNNQGVTDDYIPANNPFTTPNLARELIDASRSFITYSESLPSVGYNGATSGAYARKHNPAANWMGTGINQIAATTNQPFTAFPSSSNYASLPTVCYVVPNQDNDMHNGSDPARITLADNWMYNNLDSYIQWAKTHNSLFILTFDEDDNAPGNHITTIFTGSMVLAGQYANHIDHYNILRTIEDMYSLPYAGNSSTLINYCWKQNQPQGTSYLIANNTGNTTSTNDLKPAKNGSNEALLQQNSPNPFSQAAIIKYYLPVAVSNAQIIITDAAGNKFKTITLTQKGDGFVSVDASSLAAGSYFYTLLVDGKKMGTKQMQIVK